MNSSSASGASSLRLNRNNESNQGDLPGNPVNRAHSRLTPPSLLSNNNNNFRGGMVVESSESQTTCPTTNQQNISLSSNTVPYQPLRPIIEPELTVLYDNPQMSTDRLPGNQWNPFPNYTITWGDTNCSFPEHVKDTIAKHKNSLDQMWKIIENFAQAEPALFVVNAGPIAYAIQEIAAGQGHSEENVSKLLQRTLRISSAMERHHTSYQTITNCYGIRLRKLDRPVVEGVEFISPSNPDYVHEIGANLVGELNGLFSNYASAGEVKKKIEMILDNLPLAIDRENFTFMLISQILSNHYIYYDLENWLYDQYVAYKKQSPS